MLRPAHVIMLCAAALLGLGVVMVHSAGMSVTSRQGVSPLALLTDRNSMYALLSLVAMIVASRINIREAFRSRTWRNPLAWVLFGSLVMVGLTFVPALNRSVNGASRWLYLGPRGWGLSFQPSELVKWVMVVAIAWWCARRRGVMHRFFHGLLPPLLLVGLACGMIAIEDLGTAVLIAAVAVCVLIAGGARVWQLLLLMPAGAAGVVGFIIHSPYRLARLTAFLHPWADPNGSGYHPIQSMLAFAQGGLVGVGLGNSIQKHYIPEATSDFLFPIVCEELGLAGAVTVILLYLLILWVGLGIVRDCKDTFARLVGLGALLTLGLQASINIAVVTVVVPTKGIALPLMSAGGTGWVLTAFAVGLVAGLDNANRYEALTEHLETPGRLAAGVCD